MFCVREVLTINDDGVGLEVQWLTKDGRPLPAISDEYVSIEEIPNYERILK